MGGPEGSGRARRVSGFNIARTGSGSPGPAPALHRRSVSGTETNEGQSSGGETRQRFFSELEYPAQEITDETPQQTVNFQRLPNAVENDTVPNVLVDSPPFNADQEENDAPPRLPVLVRSQSAPVIQNETSFEKFEGFPNLPEKGDSPNMPPGFQRRPGGAATLPGSLLSRTFGDSALTRAHSAPLFLPPTDAQEADQAES